MTKDERTELRRIIALFAGDDGENDGWHEGMKALCKLADLDTSQFDIELEQVDWRLLLKDERP